MNEKSSIYAEFNIDQLIPVISELKTGNTVVINMMNALNDYKDNIYEIITNLKEATIITDELKAKIDKNVLTILDELNVYTNHFILCRNMGTKREKLFNRLSRGVNYKFKLENGIIVNNSELLQFDNIEINLLHRTITIGTITFQFSDSSDISTNSSSCISEPSSDDSDEDNTVLDCFIRKMQIELIKTLTIQSHLDTLNTCIEYAINIIKTDITHFKLFDASELDC